MDRPTYRFDVEALADMMDVEVWRALVSIEAYQTEFPADRSLDSAWRTFRNEYDHRLWKAANA